MKKLLLLTTLVMSISGTSHAQTPIETAAQPSPAIQAAKFTIPEGTEIEVRFDETISSKTSAEGDRFRISLADKISIGDLNIPAGYSGRGEVVAVKKKGFMGQAGTLNVTLDYIKIGNTKIKIRANKGKEGKGALASTIALTWFFGPLGLLKRGSDITIDKGQALTAFVDQDAEINLPLAAPPMED